MEEIEYESIIQWYCQKQYFSDMLSYARQAVDAYSSNERLRVLLALSFTLNNHYKDAFKETSSLASAEDYAVAFLSALHIQSHIYKNQETTDRLAIAQIDTKIKENRKKASAEALSLAAMILLLFKKFDSAKEYSDRAYILSPLDIFVLLSKGWCSMTSDDLTQNPGNYFEMILKENNKHFNAKYRELRGDHSGAILILNQLIVRYPKISAPLVEKINNLLALKEWEQAAEISNRILSFDNSNIDVFKLKALIVICREGNYNEAVKHVQAFFRNLILAESKNINLFIDNIKLFSRIAVKNESIISELFKFVDKMQQQNPGNAALMVQLGNMCILMDKYQEAENWYRGTVRLDESSYDGLMGLARCQLQDVSCEVENLAKQQLEFLTELHSSSHPSSKLLFMFAKLYRNNSQKALEHLDKAALALIENCSCYCYGYEYLNKLNTDLCMDIVQEYLHHSPNSNVLKSSEIEKSSCIRLLEIVIEANPGLGAALLLMGRIKMQFGDLNGAVVVLKKLLDSVDRTNAAGHLLMARILVKQGHYESASQTLEVGLSYNFQVRDDPVYHMIIGTVAKESGDLEGAIKNLNKAMSLAGLSPNQETMEPVINITVSDKATLYLELISAYLDLRKFDDATTLIEDARAQLLSSPEEGRIIIGHAELYLAMDELDQAIEMLSSIGPGEPYYVQAHTKLADIHLQRRKDRNSFAKCFRDLVENCPGSETYNMLGDAYMSIQEPERAIEAYELSQKNNPKNKALAKKMGIALMKTHQYSKAISYYKEVVKVEGCRELKLDMAELLMKLKQFDKAEEALVEELNDGRGVNDIQTLEMRGKQLLLLAKVREKAGNLKGALTTLSEAKENQVRYAQRATMLPNLLDQKNVLADICFTMAEHSSSIRQFIPAVDYYKETLSYKPNDVKALLSLAKLYMQMNELDKCTQYCQILLNTDPNNEAACVMMADLAFRKVDFDTAAFHFRQLLLQKPTYWTALARLIEVSRRTGNIDDLSEWLTRAESAMDRAKPDPGFYYCSGLLDWRIGKLGSALTKFNAVRRDPEWGQQAIYNMIEICLDPDDDSTLSREIFIDDETDVDDSKSMALKNAQKLLQELNPKGNPQEMLTHRLLSNFILLASKQKHNIEQALQDCTALASQEVLRDHVGPALGLATAHILLKQTPRARNHLKRVSKNTWTFEDAEYLERCWLLLAEIYVQSSKYDLASELLKRVLQHNVTCVRAHELSGHISEKEQSYREAATKYAQAWKYGGKFKLNIGYRLAYCYLKSKQYANAIDVCYEVLKINPDYPRIKKDILEKSMHNIRT
ncbi:PREDICTED: tetratricopeptide repeat protein 21B-like [Ceratosolen solmsi marchali]|uniref:Tetratricopeptide repeat protein 21B-like n=1 Tax=Ceratosolen solmsi marchali TaxID=326594 RepID=A0AAJ6YK95_9HYME|nr:PREDICTED: tetratricopeptide repeat protein 21B-like [Ceratosolen solmsi marchali]